MRNIILASASGIRLKILNDFSFNVKVEVANIDEDEIKNSLLAEKFSSFDISRALSITSQHVGFGHGTHRCLGFAFGSLQVEVVLQLLLLSDIAPFPSEPFPFNLSFATRTDFSDDGNKKKGQDDEVSNSYSHGEGRVFTGSLVSVV